MKIWSERIGPARYFSGMMTVCCLIPYAWRFPDLWYLCLPLTLISLIAYCRYVSKNETSLRKFSGTWPTKIQSTFFVFSAVLIFGNALVVTRLWSNAHANLIGIKNLEEARIVADQFFLDALPSLYLQSRDTCNVPKSQADAFAKYAATGWKKASVRQHHKWTKLMDPGEFESLKKDIRKDWTEEMKNEKTTWNHSPEKYLIYFFLQGDERNGAQAYLQAGLFQRDGLWYFASEYKGIE